MVRKVKSYGLIVAKNNKISLKRQIIVEKKYKI